MGDDINNDCGCNPDIICHPVVQCRSCTSTSNEYNQLHTQKIIQKQVRVASSMYTMNLGALSAGG